MKKRWIFVAAALTVALALTGCGKKDAGQNPTQDSQTTTTQAQTVALGARTKALMAEIKNAKGMHIKMKGSMPVSGSGQAEEITMDMYVKNSADVYLDMQASIGHVGMLTQGNRSYFIMHDQKVYFTSIDDEPEIKPEDLFGDLDDYNELTFSTGSEELNGTKYEYEEAREGNDVVRYYYDASGALKYIKSDGQTLEILAFESKVDESKFTLPEGYTESKLNQD